MTKAPPMAATPASEAETALFKLDPPVTLCVGLVAALLTAPTPALAETAPLEAAEAADSAAEVGAAAEALCHIFIKDQQIACDGEERGGIARTPSPL